MKNLNIKIKGLCILGFGLFAGCNKILDIKPTDKIDASNAITSMTDLSQAVVGVYSVMGNTSVQYRTAGNADIVISSLMSDENYLPNENKSGNGVNTYRWFINPEDENTAGNWGSSKTPTNPVVFTGSNYAVIDRANRVLRVIDNIPTSNNSELTSRTNLKGELLALRAYCHFQVLKSYAENYEPQSLGIPYMEVINDAPGSVKPSRPSVAETFAKIERDLLEAKQLLTTSSDITRITPAAVSAILARVSLYEKKWDEAILYATEAINNKPLASRAEFPGIWTDVNDKEIIWKLKRESDNDKIGQFYRTSADVVEYAASLKLIASYNQSDDVRFSSYIRIDPTRGDGKTPNLVNKYVGGNNLVPGLADIKLFRIAEMFLIRAEAYTEKGAADNFLKASNDINTLRSARINNYTAVDYSDKTILINEIYLERFRELAFEGHRYFDLRRRSLTIDRNPIAADDAGGASSITLTASQRAYYLPIPGFELRANENMDQNPQYR